MVKKVIPIKGDIVDNDTGGFYDFFGIEGFVSPKKVTESLADVGPEDTVELQVASNGGDVFAASEIYTALKGCSVPVTASIQGLAASAASVISMAADNITISPTAQIMIHRAWSGVNGNTEDLQHEAEVLEKIDNSIASAYEKKTGMDRGKLLNLMSDETWLGAEDAVKYGFADSIMTFDDKKKPVKVFASFGTTVPKAAITKWQAMLTNKKENMEPEDSQPAAQNDLVQSKLAILFGKGE